MAGDGLVRIIANLPYNVGTALLTGWLTGEAWPPWWTSLTLMVQREVAERIVADESDPKNYGRLGVLCRGLTWRSVVAVLPRPLRDDEADAVPERMRMLLSVYDG